MDDEDDDLRARIKADQARRATDAEKKKVEDAAKDGEFARWRQGLERGEYRAAVSRLFMRVRAAVDAAGQPMTFTPGPEKSVHLAQGTVKVPSWIVSYEGTELAFAPTGMLWPPVQPGPLARNPGGVDVYRSYPGLRRVRPKRTVAQLLVAEVSAAPVQWGFVMMIGTNAEPFQDRDLQELLGSLLDPPR